MRLNQIRFFLAVVDSGSIRGAARKLRLSPPAITKGIWQLEEELHVKLFERTQDGIVATPAARDFIPRARVVQSELRKAEEEFAQRAVGLAGSVAFGAGPSTMVLIVSEALVQFRREFPDVRVRIVEELGPTIVPLVRDGTLDFALLLKPEAELDPGLHFRPLFRDEMVNRGTQGSPAAK